MPYFNTPLASQTEPTLMCDRPIPPPSRYGYTLKIDFDSLPEGVTIQKYGELASARWLITNSSDKPLIIREKFDFVGELDYGEKLVSGEVYAYFRHGIPMEGKEHLKGWQPSFTGSTFFHLEPEPHRIYEGRLENLSKDLPEPEQFSFPAKYDGKTHEIKGFIHYHLNDLYDQFYLNRQSTAI